MINIPFSLNSICQDMYTLNVLARERKFQKWQADVFYEIKNVLVEYLYRRGFCVDARKHIQKFECWNCDGTGKDEWNDGCECNACSGTGVHHQFVLYAFKFRIGKRIWKWHQPEQYVTWPVELTETAQADYPDPPQKDLQVQPKQRKWMAFEIWFGLLMRGLVEIPSWTSVKNALTVDKDHAAGVDRQIANPGENDDPPF